MTLARRGPNPFDGATTVEIASPGSVSVRIQLVDVLGRVVADYGTSVLVGGAPRTVTVRGSGLASGVYFLSVRGGPEAAAPAARRGPIIQSRTASPKTHG